VLLKMGDSDVRNT